MPHNPNPGIRVLQVVRPAEGGMRRHLETLCPRLQRRGIEVTIAAPPGFSLDASVPVFAAPIAARANPLHDLRAAAAVAAVAEGVDLLHGHGLRGAWIANLAGGRARKPFLFTAHNLAPARLRPVAAALMRRTARRAAGVIAVSSAVGASLAQFGVAAPSLQVIPNGIDLAPFDCDTDAAGLRRRLGIEPAARVIAAAGRLSPEKGYHLLVETVPTLLNAHHNALIVIAGEGPEAARLADLAGSLGAAERIVLPGRVMDIPALFAAAEVVVAPSLAEGQGLTVLEAMAARRPVVAAAVGGIPEVVADGQTGILFSAGDPGALAQALIYLLDHADVRTRMGVAGRERVQDLFGADLMADRVAALYRTRT